MIMSQIICLGFLLSHLRLTQLADNYILTESLLQLLAAQVVRQSDRTPICTAQLMTRIDRIACYIFRNHRLADFNFRNLAMVDGHIHTIE